MLSFLTTNFFTFLATSNDRATLPQRGHSKAKRHDLRQIGLALLVTRDFQIPLLHRTYEGNIPDVKLFPQISADLITRYPCITSDTPEATLVFDKGNVSEDAMEYFALSGAHFVTDLSVNRLPEVLEAPHDHYHDIPTMPGTKAFSTVVPLWGQHLQVVVSYSESFLTQQLSGITHNMVTCQKKLFDLPQRLVQWHKGTSRGKHQPYMVFKVNSKRSLPLSL
jgi:transposase